MIEFPYGIADFHRIRREGMVYVDRTAHVQDLESLGSTLVFLRPRRFGKSLWVQTLATYYDLRYAESFGEIFGGLQIGEDPTPLRSRFFVLQWNFSLIKPRGGALEIAESLRRHVLSQAKLFLLDYTDFLEAEIPDDAGASEVLTTLLGAVRQAGRPLYLLIDEYDNFVNEVMVQDVTTYKALFEADGPYKELMKAVKNATEGLGLERVFLTGVSPVALNDLTSGFNTSVDVSLEPSLAGLCGFKESELRDLLRPVAAEKGLSGEKVEAMVETMRAWYNGYRFSEDVPNLVYNPTNALFFLKNLYLHGKPPKRLHDENLRTDRGKLSFLAKTAAGSDVVERLSEGDGEVRVPQLAASFSVQDLTEQLAKDPGVVASFLYYMGLLTLSDRPGRLRLPNLVVKKLFLDRLLEILLPKREESYQARELAMDFFEDGELGPLLAFMEEKLLRALSSRDQGAAPRRPGLSGSGVNETTLKAFFLSILFDDTRYVVHSELEVERGHVDLCLLARPEAAWPGAFDLLFELKYVRRQALGKTGQELRDLGEEELRRLAPVETAFQKGRAQATRYREALERRYGEALRLRSWVVVAVGLERLLCEETTPARGSSSAA